MTAVQVPARPAQRTLRILAALVLSCHVGLALAWQVDHRLIIEHGALAIDHGKSVAEITRAQAGGGFPADIGLGLFQNRMRTELSINTQTAGQGKRLGLVTRVKTEPVIYVARELPRDSCAYQVVLNHELLHQHFDLDVLREMPDAMRRMANEVFNPEILDGMNEAGLARARDRLMQRFRFTYDALGYPRHQAIDNPLAYQELSGRCQGEIGRMLAARAVGNLPRTR